MAQKRMFSHAVVRSDRFLSLSFAAQCLYYQLGMEGDDDGFVACPRRLAAYVGCSADTVDELINAGYLIAFPSGVVAITHWRANNTLKNDRYKPTVCTAELAMLERDGNGAYHLRSGSEPEPNFFGTCLEPQPNVTQPSVTEPSRTESNGTEPSVTEPSRTEPSEREQKPSALEPEAAPFSQPLPPRAPAEEEQTSSVSGENRAVPAKFTTFTPPTEDEVAAYYGQICVSPELARGFVDYYAAVGWKMGKSPMQDWRAAARRWAIREPEFSGAKGREPASPRPAAGGLTSAVNAAHNAQYQKHGQVSPLGVKAIQSLLRRTEG